MRKSIASFFLLSLILGFAGCGGNKKVSISGTITRGGEKMTWPNDGSLLVVYFPEDRKRDENVYRGTTDIATSTYQIEGIPPGKYTVAIQQFDLKHMDALGGAYDPSKTTITREVNSDGQVIDIDVPAPAPKEPRGKKGGDEEKK